MCMNSCSKILKQTKLKFLGDQYIGNVTTATQWSTQINRVLDTRVWHLINNKNWDQVLLMLKLALNRYGSM